MVWPAVQGFGATLALIAAIGAQNAFLLGQGVKRNHHWSAALVCMTADFLMLTAGIFGAGLLFAQVPSLAVYAQWGGGLFLIVYGAMAFRRFLNPEGLCEAQRQSSYKTVIITALAVGWLNPHAYLDTVVLLGSISSQFDGSARWTFWLGASMASAFWFVSLTWLAAKLAPYFKEPRRWRWVELFVAVSMWLIAVGIMH